MLARSKPNVSAFPSLLSLSNIPSRLPNRDAILGSDANANYRPEAASCQGLLCGVAPTLKPYQVESSQRAIELQTVLTRITKVKLSGTPRGVLWRGPGAAIEWVRADPTAFNKLTIDRVHVGHNESNGRAVRRICPLVFVGPL